MDEQIKKVELTGINNVSEAYCTRMSISCQNWFYITFLCLGEKLKGSFLLHSSPYAHHHDLKNSARRLVLGSKACGRDALSPTLI